MSDEELRDSGVTGWLPKADWQSHMTDLDDLDRLRTDCRSALYSTVGPSSMNVPRDSAVAQVVGIDVSTWTEIALWLQQRGFIGKMTMGDHAASNLEEPPAWSRTISSCRSSSPGE